MDKSVNEDVVVWLDIETTGLEPNRDPILEIGIVLAERSTGAVRDACSWVTLPMKRAANDYTRFVAMTPEEARAMAPEVVQEMHEASGLWRELGNTNISLFDAGKQIPEWLRMNGLDIKNEQFTMGGRGVDRFDRPFLRHNSVPLNNLDSIFHYRSLDVSNIYQAFRFIDSDLLWADRPESQLDLTLHRAVDDCMEALDDWRWFVEVMSRQVNWR